MPKTTIKIKSFLSASQQKVGSGSKPNRHGSATLLSVHTIFFITKNPFNQIPIKCSVLFHQGILLSAYIIV